MTDDIRQEAVRRAVAVLAGRDLFFRSRRRGIAQVIIDASGLLPEIRDLRDQLTEAIAQRDLAHSANAELGASFQEARRDALRLRKQLAAESALCDRLVTAYRLGNSATTGATMAQTLADYDAHRADEYSDE